MIDYTKNIQHIILNNRTIEYVMKDRIKQYMDYKSISAGELSSLVDVQRSNISHILNGRNKPGATFIEKLLIAFPDLNARWLYTGVGDMVIDSSKFNKNAVAKTIADANNEQRSTNNEILNKEKLVVSSNSFVDKVIVLFSDGTFTDFVRKKV